ncbi:MAG TPA: DNA alkylation repair protein [Dehalococcoidales bacterium]|nr:DNA alkylation repair protein [Dehalococcoidales bacterium]
MRDILLVIRQELKQHSDTRTQASFQRFFKEGVTAYGVKTAIVRKIARQYFKEVKPLGKRGVFALCEELLRTDNMEESAIAFEWAYRLKGEYELGDFELFEGWLKKYVNNWAKCDSLCNHAIGSLVEEYPRFIGNLKRWTKSKNRWLRRAAAVTLIVPAKQGKFLKDIFEIADSLLEDQDDLVQKGYGWLLKEASRLHQKEVFDYVLRNKRIMPRTALRYAIEKMPADLKKLAMAKG